MLAGRVIGTTTSTVKHPSMEGWKLLIVQPLRPDGVTADGDPQIAVEALGAGIGDKVIISSDGKGTRALLNSINSPVRWMVLGIVDE